MDLHARYYTPERTDICIAYCFFNTCGYVRSLQNLLLFENKLKLAKIPYFSAEMVIGDSPHMLFNPTVRYYSKSNLFYKESLWNHLEKEIPEKYTKICFLDSDIIFSKLDWVDRLSYLLDSFHLVHPFENVHYLDLSYKVDYSLVSAAKTFNYTVGFGWAIRRDFFRKIGGFFEKGMLGASDTIFFNCLKQNINADSTKPAYVLILKEILEYQEVLKQCEPLYTFLNSDIYHLFHGTRVNRQYSTREYILANLEDKNWGNIFTKNCDGFWEIIDNSLNLSMYDYFLNRNEDGDKVNTTDLDVKPSIIHLLYDKPMYDDMCVVLCYFSPCGYIRSLQNILFIENKLKLAGIPYFLAELVIGKNNPVIVNPTVRLYSNSNLFYKEQLLNYLEKYIPAKYTKLCFLDSDIIFDKVDWFNKLSDMLNSYDIVHPYSTVNYLNESYKIYETYESQIKNNKSYSPGFGYAITRECFLAIGGFFDKCIMGGGDTQFYSAVTNVECKIDYERLIIHILSYKERVKSFNPIYTYLSDYEIYHLYHGSRNNRNYENRYTIINMHEWDSIIIKNMSGLWEVIDPLVNSAFLEYFVNRDEDSPSIKDKYISNTIAEVKQPEVKQPEVKEPEVKEPEVNEPEVYKLKRPIIPKIRRPELPKVKPTELPKVKPTELPKLIVIPDKNILITPNTSSTNTVYSSYKDMLNKIQKNIDTNVATTISQSLSMRYYNR